MEALLSLLASMQSQGTFPCMPFVAWAYMKNMNFNKYEPERGEVMINQRPWALPDFTQVDFYAVPSDFIAAAFIFLGSIPQCAESVRPLQSAPSMEAIQQRMAPDHRAQFLTRLAAWLAGGRTTVACADLASWDRMALTVPFWKDADFCQHDMQFVDQNANMVRLGITND